MSANFDDWVNWGNANLPPEKMTAGPEHDVLMMMSSKPEIQQRVEDAGDRLYGLSFLGRSWLAQYVADVGTVLEEVEFWKKRALIEGEAVMQASEEAERLREAMEKALQFGIAGHAGSVLEILSEALERKA